MTELAKFEVSAANARAGVTADGDRPSVLLTIAGEVDVASSPRLELELERLLDAGSVDVVIDMAAVEFIDASGIGTLVAAAERARTAGGHIVVSRPSPKVSRVIDMLRLNGALATVWDLERAE